MRDVGWNSMDSYDLRPITRISASADQCLLGWPEIFDQLRVKLSRAERCVVAVEIYPGIDVRRIAEQLSRELQPELLIVAEEHYLPAETLREIFAETLSDDPVFNFMRPWTIDAYFDMEKTQLTRRRIAETRGKLIVIGTGAAWLAAKPDVTISVNLGRWEIQQRQRRRLTGNLGFDNVGASPSEIYKTAFFLDWRVADRCRHELYATADFFIDMTNEDAPAMLSGSILRDAVRKVVSQPFRVVPFFDPGPWGGQWMRRRFNLPDGPQNYAWGFDCVPEENSVLLAFGDRCFQLPAIVLVHEEAEALLGTSVLNRFGAEFPIRFDLLDTVNGGNLSLQVHPTETYIRDHFGMPYTQDESYYMLHSEPGASMVLGLCEGVNRQSMAAAITEANHGGRPFPAETYVASWPTAKHNHFSIPAGTVHCSGAGNVVLEISATPYIFTFKLWDWGRTGLDGRPRPIHLQHGLANICWDRTTNWVRDELVGQTTLVQQGEGWREERTGLHSSQFLETRRHWFVRAVPHHTDGNLNVLNLVEGNAAIISSPLGKFAPMTVHYAETFIVPASVGAYTIAPATESCEPLATLKAFVRR